MTGQVAWTPATAASASLSACAKHGTPSAVVMRDAKVPSGAAKVGSQIERLVPWNAAVKSARRKPGYAT